MHVYNYNTTKRNIPTKWLLVVKIDGFESQLDHVSVKFTNYGACAVGLQMDHAVLLQC